MKNLKQVLDEHKDIKAIYAVYNETSTGTTIRYMDKLGIYVQDMVVSL